MSTSAEAVNEDPVIPSLTSPGVPIEVWVEVDGKKVPYYSREYDEMKKEVTCWIESEAGKSFAVNYKPTTKERSLGIDLYLDGTITACYTTDPKYAHTTYSISNIQVSNEEVRSLTFGTLELTDDDAYLKQRSKTEESFGEIRVVILSIASSTKRSGSKPAVFSIFSMPDTTKVHERAKKGLTHLIKQGETKKQAALPNHYDVVDGPQLTTFVFRYRPRAMLQANGVMPPDPTQSPSSTPSQSQSSLDGREASSQEESEDENDNAGEDEEEERALLARLEEIKKKRQLAQESGNGGNNRRKRVKTERVAPKLNFTPGEIIDATDDIRVVVPTSESNKQKIVIDLTV